MRQYLAYLNAPFRENMFHLDGRVAGIIAASEKSGRLQPEKTPAKKNGRRHQEEWI